jgi:hypothetical protein
MRVIIDVFYYDTVFLPLSFYVYKQLRQTEAALYFLHDARNG